MNRTDDIANLFNRFGASADSYLEFESDFDYKAPPLAVVRPPAVPTAVSADALKNDPIAAAPVKLNAAVTHLPVAVAEPLPHLPVDSDVLTDALSSSTQALKHESGLRLAPATSMSAPLRNLLAEVALARQSEAKARNDEALRQSLLHDQPPKSKAHVIALVSAKGGVGKSTLSAALASTLRLEGGQTLAIDLDPQNALQYHLGVNPDVAGMGNASLLGDNWRPLLLPGSAGSLLLPYGSLSEDERRMLERYLENDRCWLARQLARMDLTEHDVVIIDTPAGRTVYTEQALLVADQILVVTTADAASYVTLDQMERFLDTRTTQAQPNYVVNQFDATRTFCLDMYEVFKRRLGSHLLGAVSLDHTIGEALAYGHNPMVESGSSPACREIRMLSDRFKRELTTASQARAHAS